MPDALPNLIQRQTATQATMKRYRHKQADWRTGITCLHMARFHLRQMGRKVPTIPRIRSEFAAKRELKARGWKNVAEMLDSMLERITPASMALGDLAVARSTEGIGAILICAGHHKLLGWREDAPEMVVLDVTLDELDGAWRA